LALGKNKEAVSVLMKAIELWSRQPDYHANLGDALRAVKRFDEAYPGLRPWLTEATFQVENAGDGWLGRIAMNSSFFIRGIRVICGQLLSSRWSHDGRRD
jgi:hypothetical protein